jgi:hypothetical protein
MDIESANARMNLYERIFSKWLAERLCLLYLVCFCCRAAGVLQSQRASNSRRALLHRWFEQMLATQLQHWLPVCVAQRHSLLLTLSAVPAAFAIAAPLQLVSYNPNERPTAGEALLHRWFEQMPVVAGMATPSGTGSVLVTSSVAAATAVRSLSNSVGSTVGTVGKRVTDAIPTGTLSRVCHVSHRRTAWWTKLISYCRTVLACGTVAVASQQRHLSVASRGAVLLRCSRRLSCRYVTCQVACSCRHARTGADSQQPAMPC